jgi:4-amino-4-deoxy-L-arabinose transferase-like glycosyltransferase
MTPDQVSTNAPNSSPASSQRGFDGEKIPPYVLAILMAYAAVKNLCQAATRPFWYDEICTFIMVRQQNISTMWSALRNAADGQPPGFYLAERVATPLVTNESIAFRLLSIFGFSSAVLCIFLLVRKRRGSAIALLCALMLLATPLYDTFAVEARPYSLVFACISFALLCYQRAPAIGWTILLGLSLAFAQSSHYYALFAFLPFLVSEFVLFLATRQLRWGVWLALLCGFLPLMAFWSMLSRSKSLYGRYFWSPPSLQMAKTSYSWYLNTSYLTGIVLAGLSAVAVLATMLYMIRRAGRGEPAAEVLSQEPVMALVFLSLPFVGFVATTLTGGGMTPKYLLPTVLGFPLAVSYAFPRMGRRSAILTYAITIFILLSFAPREILFWSFYNGHFTSPADSVEALVSTAGHENLPVVISNAQDFMPLAHYASPGWAPRFVFVVDAPQAVIYTGTDNGDKELPILATYSPLHVYDFQAFVAEHPVFLLYSGNGGTGGDWWPRRLDKDRYTLLQVATKPLADHHYYHTVFLVSRNINAD